MWTREIWYASGAEHWHGILSDMLWFAESYEPSAYFANFDAIAENQHMSYGTNNEKHDTLSSWYANGTLKLRGFFFGEINSELQFLLMSVQSPTQVIGYGVRDGQLYRFEEYTDGDYEVLSAACPSVLDAVRFRSLAAFSALLYLPEPHPGVPPSA